MSDHLKSIVQDIVNGRGEQALATFNKYVTAKTQELAGLAEKREGDDLPEPTNEASTPFQKFKSLARKYQLAMLNGNETADIEKKIKAMPNGVKLMSIARAAERKFSDLAGPHHSVGAAIPKADLKKADAVLDKAEALLTKLDA